MTTIFYFPVAAGFPELLLYLAIAAGWIIIQVIKKSAREKPPSQSTSITAQKPETDLDDFLAEMTNRGQQPDETETVQSITTEPEPPAQPTVNVQRQTPSKPVRKPTQPDEHDFPYSHKQRVNGLLFPTMTFSPGNKRVRQSSLVAYIKSPGSRRQAIVYRDIMDTPKGLKGLEALTVGGGE